ncbi:hypothetical protein [Amycolatopsis sp. NPDC004079]|uniref:hypothetical protein n=1 Tax=Amycolatopsis sp. NPDC004079 TaxID=3154549 RepID=UPI0033BB3C68
MDDDFWRDLDEQRFLLLLDQEDDAAAATPGDASENSVDAALREEREWRRAAGDAVLKRHFARLARGITEDNRAEFDAMALFRRGVRAYLDLGEEPHGIPD